MRMLENFQVFYKIRSTMSRFVSMLDVRYHESALDPFRATYKGEAMTMPQPFPGEIRLEKEMVFPVPNAADANQFITRLGS
jgi:hypothetical protein